jgi:anti-sigma B factor antagonist
MALTLHVCPGDVGTIVWVSGDVDFNTAGAFQDMLLRVMRRHSPWLLVDLSGVSFMDCAGLRALMRTRRRAELRRGSVCVIAESAAVNRIIEILGARDILPVPDRLGDISGLLLSLLDRAEFHHCRSVHRVVKSRPS